MERKRREQSRVWPPETKSEAPGAPDSASLGEDRKSRPSNKDQVEGEGSYSGTRDYNERTKEFLKSGKAEKAARDAEGRAHGQAARQGRGPRVA